ncbi:MAG: AzlD domain-containing protein [Bacillota bacterium]|jgi:branched-subunit amino acid transport protein
MRKEVLVLFLAMMAVTYVPRMLPLVVLSRLELPVWLTRFLAHVPAAVLAALVAPHLLVAGDGLALSFDNLPLVAAVPTIAVAIKTRSLFLPILVGLGTIVILNLLL